MPGLQPTTIRPLSGLRLVAAVQDIEESAPDASVIATNLIASAKANGRPVPDMATFTQAITSVEPQSNLQGTSSIVIGLVDPQWELLDSGFFDADQNSEIDPIDMNYPPGSEYWWRLSQVSPKANHTIQITFLNKYAMELMSHKGPVKADRAKTTRAEFIKMLCGKVPELEFISRQLRTQQPIGDSKAHAQATSNRKAHKQKGLAPGDTVTYKFWDGSDVTLNAGQMANAQTVCDVCESHSAPERATLACLAACIVEPPNFDNPSHGDASSQGILQLLASTAAGLGVSARDVAACVSAFLTKGFYGRGGAIDLANKNPSMPVGTIAQSVQGSAYPDRYQKVEEGAKKVLAAYGGAGGGSFQEAQPYYFTVNASETFWDAIQRLAQEVNWALVLDGNRVYYDSETTLAQQQPAAVVTRDQEGVSDWNYDWDVRQLATQFTIVLICDPFDFHAGDCLKLNKFGPASTGSTCKPPLPGRWLISEIDRDRHKADGTFTLKQPTPPKAEPAPQVKTVSGAAVTGGRGTALAAFQYAQRLSKLALPYYQGSRQLVDPPPASGYDCSASTAWILWKAGMYNGPTGWAWVSGEFAAQWGQAGQGKLLTVWANADHVFIEFHIPGQPHSQANTSGLGPGPRFGSWGGNGQADAQSGAFTARHWPGQ